MLACALDLTPKDEAGVHLLSAGRLDRESAERRESVLVRESLEEMIVRTKGANWPAFRPTSTRIVRGSGSPTGEDARLMGVSPLGTRSLVWPLFDIIGTGTGTTRKTRKGMRGAALCGICSN